MRQIYRMTLLALVLLPSWVGLWAQNEHGNNTGNKELIKDEFFYNFNGDQPKDWTVVGKPTMYTGRGGYNASTGNAVGIETADAFGSLEQLISMASFNTGDEFEGLLHYYVEDGSADAGGLRLWMQWLDDVGRELTAPEERKLLNNEELWFSRIKSWGTLRFRTRKPEGATKFRFAVQINKRSNVRIDDVSFAQETQRTPFVTILPQNVRPHYLEIGQRAENKFVVQTYHQRGALDIELTEGIPFRTDKGSLPSGTGLTELTLICQPVAAGKVPRGRKPAALTIGGGLSVPLSVFSIDPNNRPSLAVTPSPIGDFTYIQGDAISPQRELQLDFENMIDNVRLEIVPAGQGFFLSNTSVMYFEQARPPHIQEGVNDTKVRVSFRRQEVGEVNAELVITSPMFETKRIPLKGIVRPASDLWKETFKALRPAPADPRLAKMQERGYNWFDQGLWQLWSAAVWEKDSQEVFFYNEASTLVYAGGFSQGLIYNEDFPSGIASVRVKGGSYASDGALLALEVSHDHGGTWHRPSEPKKVSEGKFVTFEVNTHQPTLFRLVRTNGGGFEGSFAVSEVIVSPSEAADRLVHQTLVDLVDFTSDKALPLYAQSFDGQLHHSPLAIEGWRNISFAGNRPWVSYTQSGEDSGTGEPEEVAKVTLYKATPQSERELTSFLVSPLLDYTGAKTKELTFRLYRQTAIDADKFFIYLGAVKDGKIAELHEVPFKLLAPNRDIKDRIWYDYLLNLADYKLEGIDRFVVIYALQSPVGGNETSTTYLIDDFSWGREDNPVITVDRPIIPFYQMSFAPEQLQVTTKHAKDVVRTSLFGVGRTPMIFQVSPATLAPDGGTMSVSIDRQKLKDRTKDHASLLFLSTRGGANVEVKLFATPKTERELQDTSVEEVGDGSANAYAYRSADMIHVVAPGLLSVEAYDLLGVQVAQAWGADRLSFASAGRDGALILVLRYADGKRQTIKL
ncbi:MAG: hypothetical protein Q4A61_01315 [Porphyromonadaceae bacterium]|nr:hypothetical protein [Porphyromonadaceae bacterium]